MDAEIARRRGGADGADAKGTRDSLQGMYNAAKCVPPPLLRHSDMMIAISHIVKHVLMIIDKGKK